MKLYRRDLKVTDKEEMHLEVDHYLTPIEITEKEAKIDIVSFLWWLDSYYSRGMIKNKDGKLELHWSNKEEAAELWDEKEAPIYTSIELKEKFLATLNPLK